MNSAHVEQFIARNLRWNYFTLTFDWVFYVFALSLVSSTTVMPAFARHLGASNLVIGAIPAASTLGFLLPGIFAANYAVVGFFRGAFPFPINYSLCFAGAFVAAMTSYLVVGSTREYPQSSDKPVVGFATYMDQLPAVLRRDCDFCWFLIVRGAMTAGGLANGFFTAFSTPVPLPTSQSRPR